MHSTTAAPVIAPRLGLASQPVYATLVQFPAVCFVGALITDLAYWRTELYIWETFSIWLITMGCIFAGFAFLAGLITWISHRHVRQVRHAGLHAIVSIVALALSIVNAFVHSRDGYVAVVPDGLVLSIAVFVLMCIATWLGWPRTQVAYVAPGANRVGAV